MTTEKDPNTQTVGMKHPDGIKWPGYEPDRNGVHQVPLLEVEYLREQGFVEAKHS